MEFDAAIKGGRAEYRDAGRRVRVFACGPKQFDIQADLLSGTFGGELNKQDVRALLQSWRVPLETGWEALPTQEAR